MEDTRFLAGKAVKQEGYVIIIIKVFVKRKTVAMETFKRAHAGTQARTHAHKYTHTHKHGYPHTRAF